MSQTALAEPRRTRPEPVSVAPPSAAGRYVSEEEYWLNYYLESDVHYEWNNGRLEEKPMSNYETFRSRVLPGLQFRLADLCRRPMHGTLRADTQTQARQQAERRSQEAEQALARLQAQLAGRDPAQ